MKDRILGLSEMIDLDNRTVFFATGNHLTITGDLTRRALLVSLDANMEKPETRKFTFNPEDRAREQHPQLLAAALTALRAYVVADEPWNLKRAKLGGFEKWDGLVCGCLTWLGFADPFETRDTIIGEDPDREANLAILSAWHREFKSDVITASEIETNIHSETRRLLLTKGEWDIRTVGWRLRYLKDKVVGNYKLVKGQGIGGSDHRYWKVILLGKLEGQLF